MAKRRALIIDDEAGSALEPRPDPRGRGLRVATAADGDQGLRAAQAERFERVLCDVRMPRKGGLEILEELIRAQADATVLVMSAFGHTEQALEAVRKGAFDFLAKPFQAQELLLAIRKAEERERLQRENRRLKARALARCVAALAAASPLMRRGLRADRARAE